MENVGLGSLITKVKSYLETNGLLSIQRYSTDTPGLENNKKVYPPNTGLLQPPVLISITNKTIGVVFHTKIVFGIIYRFSREEFPDVTDLPYVSLCNLFTRISYLVITDAKFIDDSIIDITVEPFVKKETLFSIDERTDNSSLNEWYVTLDLPFTITYVIGYNSYAREDVGFYTYPGIQPPPLNQIAIGNQTDEFGKPVITKAPWEYKGAEVNLERIMLGSSFPNN